jgi:hypothetical protein
MCAKVVKYVFELKAEWFLLLYRLVVSHGAYCIIVQITHLNFSKYFLFYPQVLALAQYWNLLTKLTTYNKLKMLTYENPILSIEHFTQLKK